MVSPPIFDRYLLKSLSFATVFTAITLAAIIMLTQSLRFLELVIDSGASSTAFWILTALALPRFLEIILPIALMIAIVFIYNRMSTDSEIVVMRAAGFSPLRLSRPALVLAAVITAILLFITTWLAPVSITSMQQMRQVIKAQYSTLLFREGVFNEVGDDLTVYIADRNSEGELEGLVIHDSRPELEAPVTVIAKRGVMVFSDDGQQVLVFDGSRQDFNKKTGALNRLDFERYSIDMPESGPVRQRWKEPDERTFYELLNPDPNVRRDVESHHEFMIEAHRRIISPFLTLTFALIALNCLLLGPVDRRGQGKRIALIVLAVTLLEGLHLAVYNLATQNVWGLPLMYLLIFAPLLIGLFLLSQRGEVLRHQMMYRRGEAT